MKYCAKCGSILGDEDISCTNCGAIVGEGNAGGTAAGGASAGPTGQGPAASSIPGHEFPPPKYTTQAVLAIIFCCWPFAIPALVYSNKGEKLFAKGQRDEAWAASATAKKWLIASVVSGCVLMVFYLIMTVVQAISKS
jgi:hypothetical protein